MPANPILPGSTLGMVGDGQLGRMFVQAAQRMGYRVHVYGADASNPAAQLADALTIGAYTDLDRMTSFAQQVSAVSYESENLPVDVLRAVQSHVPVRPDPALLELTQHRLREKGTLSQAGFPVPTFAAIHERRDLKKGLREVGTPAILKTATSGYDGKGQRRIHRADQAVAAWQDIPAEAHILEACVDFEREISVVGARGIDGEIRCFDPIENAHHNHILDVSVCPARIPATVRRDAMRMTRDLLHVLDVVGVLCVEFFVLPKGQLMINELAPRPHNSGHLTLDACITSQFEQQVRALCGLPLGAPDLWRPAAMANLMGELWESGTPRWELALQDADARLHLYGKARARCARKMGHLTLTAASGIEAERRVRALRDALCPAEQPSTVPDASLSRATRVPA